MLGIDGVQISIDNVIVHAVTMEELINRLHKVFKRCCANNLSLNQSKSEFGVTKISVLGHVVSADGIKPDPKKCEAIKATPPPKNVSDLRSFLGTCGYVSKFIPNYANIVEPLRKLTRSEAKFSWGKGAKRGKKLSISKGPFRKLFYCCQGIELQTRESPPRSHNVKETITLIELVYKQRKTLSNER